jgi:hypothetical protein
MRKREKGGWGVFSFGWGIGCFMVFFFFFFFFCEERGVRFNLDFYFIFLIFSIIISGFF